MITESIITCPACGTAKLEVMPTDACQYFYECTGCGTLLRPKAGECCVFCSYGSMPCPPIQASPNEAPCCESTEGRAAAEIRPGVHRPDWAAVTNLPRGRRSLVVTVLGAGPSAKWLATLPAEHDRVWRTVLDLYGRLGRSPLLAEIGNAIGLTLEQVRAIVAELETHDLLRMDAGADAIAYAYLFTSQETEHRVELHGHTLNALCAIDALGVGGMLRADVTITSSCRFCGTDVAVETARHGGTVKHARPATTVVWYDLAYGQAAASSCCPAISFFCCDEHLKEWLAAHGSPRAGHRLALDEALEVGRAIFEPALATATATAQDELAAPNR